MVLETITRVDTLEERADAANTYIGEVSAQTEAVRADLSSEILAMKNEIEQGVNARVKALESTMASALACADRGLVWSAADGTCTASCPKLDTDCEAACDGEGDLGRLRHSGTVVQSCGKEGWIDVNQQAPGSSRSSPAGSCRVAQRSSLNPSGVSGFFYIGEIGEAVKRWCDMSKTPAEDLGGDGTEASPGKSCEVLVLLAKLPAGDYVLESGVVSCGADGKPLKNGNSAATAANSCKDIIANGHGAGNKWVTYGGEPFLATCIATGGVQLDLQPSPWSSTAWMLSYSSDNNWWKCRCAAMNTYVNGRRGSWHTAQVSSSIGDQKCQKHFQFKYKTGGRDVSDYSILTRLGKIGKVKRNFKLQTFSCDDDNVGYPGGHWIAIESSRGNNQYKQHDCKSGEGGGGQGCPTCPTSNGGGCCNHNVLGRLDWASAPILDKVCGSINTGGGVVIGYDRTNLIVGPE